ncbi:hypothetical protein GCM10009624_06340 [Gordonia sinesedis]
MTPFADDDLDEFYRRIEALTAARPRRRRPARPSYDACPTPDKEPFGTERAALDGIDRIARVRRYTGLRCYRCACGAWHITSSPPRPERLATRRSRRGSRGRR